MRHPGDDIVLQTDIAGKGYENNGESVECGESGDEW